MAATYIMAQFIQLSIKCKKKYNCKGTFKPCKIILAYLHLGNDFM